MKTVSMKKIRRAFALAAMALVAGTTIQGAEPITETFDNFDVKYDFEIKKYLVTMPDGWDFFGEANVNYSKGTDSGTYRQGSKPSIGIGESNTTTYIITPILEGEFNFYLRNYTKSYQASVSVYSCTPAGDSWTIGDQIGEEVVLTKVTNPSFQKVSFSVSSPTHVALLISYAYFDDFTYTPAEAVDGPVLAVEDFENGSTYNFGTVPADTRQTFRLINRGDGDLSIERVTLTGEFTLVTGSELKTIAAGQTENVVVATKDCNATGELRIVSNNPDGDYVINLQSTYKVPEPEMQVDLTTIDFGTTIADTEREFIVNNVGDATLTVEITSSNDEFSVDPTTLSIEPGQNATVTVKFAYDANKIGVHKTTLTLSPNEGEDLEITVTAKVPDPNEWSEDFESDKLPEEWEIEGYADCWTFADGEVISEYDSTQKGYLITPWLNASEGQELTFDYKTTKPQTSINIYIQKQDGEFEPEPFVTISEPSKTTEFKTYVISGLEPGSYRFKFENDDYILDNFKGFKLDSLTGIHSITTDDKDHVEIYNLQGIRVKDMTVPGVYIINGKKILVNQ